MKSNQEAILFRTRLGAAPGEERCFSRARTSLEWNAVPSCEPGAAPANAAIWPRLRAYLQAEASAGRVVAGVLGYELLHAVEAIATIGRSDCKTDRVPDLLLHGYETIKRIGLPENVLPIGDGREESDAAASAGLTSASRAVSTSESPVATRATSFAASATSVRAVPALRALPSGARADRERSAYEAAIKKAREAIFAGEFFEVCFTQGITADCHLAADEIYERLSALSPAAAAALMVTPEFAVISNSPEHLLIRQGDTIESWPIKGTARRDLDAKCDAALAAALIESEKDRAELAMIVDVTRNDLGRVAEVGSVAVIADARLHTTSCVHHLEAVVRARLAAGLDIVDAIRAIFPGGSVTGAPKVRAMQEIAAIETHRRGPYCGAMAVFEPDGAAYLSVAIRTGVLAGGRFRLHSGGAVTADSQPAREYEEMLAKASALLAAIKVEQ